MRITANEKCHTTNEAKGITILPTNTTCSKLSTAQINYIITSNDRKKITKIKPDISALLSFYQRSENNADIWGTNLECSNRTNIPTWLLSSYKSLSDAINNTNKITGNYIYSNHFYPSMYDTAQFFFLGSKGGGIRANSAFNTSAYSENQFATLWIKEY